MRILAAERLFAATNSLRYKRLLMDFPWTEFTNVWDDTVVGSFHEEKLYVVQTSPKVITRCLLMTTDPGDLVLDPTCGSGTTALVGEQWGRRWITIDTSRVALALARQRLLTSKFDYYKLRPVGAEGLKRNPSGQWLTDPNDETKAKATFACKSVPHITLKSIAQNVALDAIFAKHQPILDAKLKTLNDALKKVPADLRQKLNGKLLEKEKREGKKSVTEADRRRWSLPKEPWREWEVPFDADGDWPAALQSALKDYRAAWRGENG